MKNDDFTVKAVIVGIVILIVYYLVRSLIVPNPDAYHADKVPKYIREYMSYYDEDKHDDAWRAGYAQGFADAVESVGDWIYDHANLEYYKIWEDGLHTGYEYAED